MTNHLKNHWMHLGCAAMVVVAVVLIVGGAGVFAAVIPAIGCLLMMGLMMWMMGGAMHRSGGASGHKP